MNKRKLIRQARVTYTNLANRWAVAQLTARYNEGAQWAAIAARLDALASKALARLQRREALTTGMRKRTLHT